MPKKDTLFFTFNNKEVKAGGIIFYRHKNNSIDLLLSISDRSVEDMGGCIDKEDVNIYETVAREVSEESNKKFKIKNLIKRLEDSRYIYTPKSKYVIFILEATETEAKFKKEDFGDTETHDNIKRTIKWIPIEIFLKQEFIEKLNWRLVNSTLFKTLKELIVENTIFSKFIK